jgi:hypothetical protein
MYMKNIKKVVKENIVQNFMEAAKFARRGAEKQRPKSWSKGTKSGSDKRKMREQGKRDAQQINEEGHDEERDAVAMGYGSAAGARRDKWGHSPEQIERAEEIARQQDQETETNRRSWSATNVLPLLQKHGMEELAKKTDPNGMPTYAFTHPNSTAFYQDFIAAHTAGIQDNKENNYGEIGRARFHKNAITDAQQRMDLDTRLNAKKMQQSTGDLSEMYYNRLKEETNEIPRHAQVTGEEVYGAMDPHAEDREQLMGKQPDGLHAEHYEDFMKTLKGTQDPSQGKLLVTRGAIGAALGRASMSNSKDPILRDVVSILGASRKALDDHFNLQQQKGDIRF